MRIKQLLALIMLAALIVFGASASGEPAWDYPLAANLLENKNGNLTLASLDALLPADFVPNNLQPLKLRGVSGPHELRKEAAEALTALFAAAEEDGYQLYVKSSYRSYKTQSTMYANRLEKYGKDDGVVAKPGSSDHQTGLGVDVLNRENRTSPRLFTSPGTCAMWGRRRPSTSWSSACRWKSLRRSTSRPSQITRPRAVILLSCAGNSTRRLLL